MKTFMCPIFIALFILLPVSFVVSQEREASRASAMKPDQDGELQPDEYEVLTSNGGLTRRPCPYTCEMRGVARQHCREWKSRDQSLCYVWDTRFPQDAVPVGSGK